MKLLSFLLPLLGTTLGAILSYTYIRHLEKIRVVMNLYSEFHSADFLKARIVTDQILTKYILSDNCTKTSELYEQIDWQNEEWKDVSRVLHFFEQIYILYQGNMLHKKTTHLLFKKYIQYYHEKFFSKLESDKDDWEEITTALKNIDNILKDCTKY